MFPGAQWVLPVKNGRWHYGRFCRDLTRGMSQNMLICLIWIEDKILKAIPNLELFMYNSVTPFAILTCLICAPWTKQYQLICHFVPPSSSLSYCGAADSCHKLYTINPHKVRIWPKFHMNNGSILIFICHIWHDLHCLKSMGMTTCFVSIIQNLRLH